MQTMTFLCDAPAGLPRNQEIAMRWVRFSREGVLTAWEQVPQNELSSSSPGCFWSVVIRDDGTALAFCRPVDCANPNRCWMGWRGTDDDGGEFYCECSAIS